MVSDEISGVVSRQSGGWAARVGRLRSLLLLLVLCLLSSSAFAQNAADRETARNLMDVGRAKYEAKDYASALEAFSAADKIMGVSSTGLWVGKTLVELGRLVEARDKLIAVTQLPVASSESDILTEAREEAGALQQGVAERIPTLEIELQGLQPGDQRKVWIDGRELAPELVELPVKVDPGKHLVVGTSPGYVDQRQKIEVGEGEKLKVVLVLERGANPTEEETDDGGAGVHPLVWIGFGTAGAGILVGAITGGLSLSAAADAKDGCVEQRCPVENQSDADSSTALAHVSTIGFVVAGVGAGLGVVGLFLSGDDDSESSEAAAVRLEPTLGLGVVGLQGRF